MRSIWNDVWLLWYEYRRQRSLHPRWRRLELVRAGLESLKADDPMARLRVLSKEIREGFIRVRALRDEIERLEE